MLYFTYYILHVTCQIFYISHILLSCQNYYSYCLTILSEAEVALPIELNNSEELTKGNAGFVENVLGFKFFKLCSFTFNYYPTLLIIMKAIKALLKIF